MFKKTNLIFLYLSLFGLIFACGKTGPNQPTSKQAAPKQPGHYAVIAADSLMVVTAVKDDNIPVKGSVQITDGDLLQGDDGFFRATVKIDFSTWDSGLALRDQRVRDIFFQVQKPNFATAVFTSDPISIDGLKDATDTNPVSTKISGHLQFAGLTQDLSFDVIVKNQGSAWLVEASKPIAIQISGWGLDAAKQALMMICGHREIADAVAVSFNVKFE